MYDALTDVDVNLKLALEHGLSESEFLHINTILGRTPTITELGIFSVMWSEHCSYKNSIAELKTLPRTGERLLVGAGEENAGLVDIGDGLAVAFKIESHNHPSAVEPYQGAATGIGGILRDIFTMGARPIAALDSLRFGKLDYFRTKYLMKGIVKGIGDYGNSFGVPTIAGDVYFEDCYNENPLVNAMAVGIVEHSRVAKAIAKGQGNLVMIVGSSTGRDGIHGATFASEEISEKSEMRRPSVQVGDPFTEKLLLEATLEVIQTDYVVGIQDMGAAGIACSTSEMSARGNSGMLIDIDRVPVRESHMSPYEILLSESQERMLLVVSPKNEESVRSVFAKWDIRCQVIGRVTSDKNICIKENGHTVANIPAESLVLGGGAPVYHPTAIEPEYIQRVRKLDLEALEEPTDYTNCLRELLCSPNICSRRWISEQYDSMVRTNTMGMSGDAAVVRIKDRSQALALKTDCNARYVYLNPFRGAQIAVAEAARNVVCVGAQPIAITNCLNFGNPNKPEMFWQFKEAVRGIGDACRVLNTPVTGGNVSFYNENPAASVYPTPVIGMLGLINDVTKTLSASFKKSGDVIILLGNSNGQVGGSEYLKVHYGLVGGEAPIIDLQDEKKLHTAVLELINQSLLHSAHDLSEGGLAVAVAESCIYSVDEGNCLGASLKLDHGQREDFVLFGEDQSRILITTAQNNLGTVKSLLERNAIPFKCIGKVIEKNLTINEKIEVDVQELHEIYTSELYRRMEEVG